MKRFFVLLLLLYGCLGTFAQVEGQPIEILNTKDGTKLYGYVEKQKGSSVYFHTYYAYRKLYSQNKNTETDRVPSSSLPPLFIERLNNIVPSELIDFNDDGVKLSSISIPSVGASPVVNDNGVHYNSPRPKVVNVILDKANNSGTWYWDLNDAEYLDIVPLSDVASIERKYELSSPVGILDVITFQSGTGVKQKISGHIVKQIPGKSVVIRTADNTEREILNSDIQKQEISKMGDNLEFFYQAPFLDVIYLKNGEKRDGIILEKNISESFVAFMANSYHHIDQPVVDIYKLSEISALGKKPNGYYEEQIAKQDNTPIEDLKKEENKYFLQGDEATPCSSAIDIDEYDPQFYVIKADAFNECQERFISDYRIKLAVPNGQDIEDFHIVKLSDKLVRDKVDYHLSVVKIENEDTRMRTGQFMGLPEVNAQIDKIGYYLIINLKTKTYFILNVLDFYD